MIKITACVSLAVVAALFSGGLFSPKAAGNAVPTVDSGAALFQTNCARCHGPEGKGGKGPNLASEKRQAKWRDSGAKLVKKISGGGFIMPAFGKKLKPGDISAIAAHVRTLKE